MRATVRMEWALATASPCRPQTYRRGAARSPCPRLRLAGSTPSGDCVPQCLRHRLPPFGLTVKQAFLEKSFSSGPAGARNSEEWRAIRWRIVRRYRNRPGGGMFATECYAMACHCDEMVPF